IAVDSAARHGASRQAVRGLLSGSAAGRCFPREAARSIEADRGRAVRRYRGTVRDLMSLSASLAAACRVSIARVLCLAGCATKQASLTFDEIKAVVAVLKGFVSEKVAHCVR